MRMLALRVMIPPAGRGIGEALRSNQESPWLRIGARISNPALG